MSQPDPSSYQPPSQAAQKTRQARAARQRLPFVWLVVVAAIAAVFVVGILIAVLR
jgi:hypothetical protein